jgi:hypothetical protein
MVLYQLKEGILKNDVQLIDYGIENIRKVAHRHQRFPVGSILS